jgi:hypothetical protein
MLKRAEIATTISMKPYRSQDADEPNDSRVVGTKKLIGTPQAFDWPARSLTRVGEVVRRSDDEHALSIFMRDAVHFLEEIAIPGMRVLWGSACFYRILVFGESKYISFGWGFSYWASEQQEREK